MHEYLAHRLCGWRGGSAGGAFTALAFTASPTSRILQPVTPAPRGLTPSSGPFPHPHMHMKITLHMSILRAAASQPEGDSKPSFKSEEELHGKSCHKYMICGGGVLKGKSP